MSRLMSSNVETNEILNELGKVINKMLPAERIVISIGERAEGETSATYVFGVPVPERGNGDTEWPWSGSRLTAALERVVTVTPTDEIDRATPQSNYSEYCSRQAGLRSAMYAPLVADGDLVGTLNVKST
jgi:hypothetical protein